jgi:hypothetical protein
MKSDCSGSKTSVLQNQDLESIARRVENFQQIERINFHNGKQEGNLRLIYIYIILYYNRLEGNLWCIFLFESASLTYTPNSDFEIHLKNHVPEKRIIIRINNI